MVILPVMWLFSGWLFVVICLRLKSYTVGLSLHDVCFVIMYLGRLLVVYLALLLIFPLQIILFPVSNYSSYNSILLISFNLVSIKQNKKQVGKT